MNEPRNELPNENKVAPWQKAALIILTFSEIGLIPFLADSISDSIDITTRIFNISSPYLPKIKVAAGYGLASPYALSAMLSVGNIDESIKKLLATDQDANDVGCLWKTIQYILVGSSFIVGAAAASVGVLQRWGHTWPFYVLAAFTLTGQITTVLLQANKRIVFSAGLIRDFILHDRKSHLVRSSCTKHMMVAIINTLCNMAYWGAFYYYIGATFSQLFDLPRMAEVIISLICTALGAYMSFTIQGLNEIHAAYLKSTAIEINPQEEGELFKNPNFISITLIALSFLCRTIAVIGFSYSLMGGETEADDVFNKGFGIASLAMVLPGAASATQYVKYIHNQVNDALHSIKDLVSCKRLTLFSEGNRVAPVSINADQPSNEASHLLTSPARNYA